MITYDLKCDHGHQFEGWFRSREDFDAQCQKKLVSCPICESSNVTRCLSSPRVNRHGLQPDNGAREKAAMAQMVYQYLYETSEDVGRDFAKEVRKIHYEETEYRRIRGIASKDEVESLHEEGIDVMPLDWTPPDRNTH